MATEHNKTDAEIVEQQLDFFARNRSGCGFAAFAARSPSRYEWLHKVVRPDQFSEIDCIIEGAAVADGVSTLSLVFPDVRTDTDLDSFLPFLAGKVVYLHSVHDTPDRRCYRFRARVCGEESYVSGFGQFDVMPVTRRTPFTSIVMRVKPRPPYDWHLKKPEEGLVHVADMDMNQDLSDKNLKAMWNNSFLTVRGLLGADPNEESAAKTTFVIPLDRAARISLSSEQ
ncbi:hypothetical protein [Qipengyuania sediminis]|uniref:hypothetical protein n=1 Tax=Qipengyuania sediminis TaxID=1532023 RepID=UPI00105AA862|nr:hypothetical protein [Qipengyuania sediminis]